MDMFSLPFYKILTPGRTFCACHTPANSVTGFWMPYVNEMTGCVALDSLNGGIIVSGARASIKMMMVTGVGVLSFYVRSRADT